MEGGPARPPSPTLFPGGDSLSLAGACGIEADVLGALRLVRISTRLPLTKSSSPPESLPSTSSAV